jgi:hypothetical protein
MVAYTYNPSYLGSGELEDHSVRSARQKVTEAPSQPIGGAGLSSQLRRKHK